MTTQGKHINYRMVTDTKEYLEPGNYQATHPGYFKQAEGVVEGQKINYETNESSPTERFFVFGFFFFWISYKC